MGVHVLQRASATGAEMLTFRIGARFAWSDNFLNLSELGALSGLFDSDGKAIPWRRIRNEISLAYTICDPITSDANACNCYLEMF